MKTIKVRHYNGTELQVSLGDVIIGEGTMGTSKGRDVTGVVHKIEVGNITLKRGNTLHLVDHTTLKVAQMRENNFEVYTKNPKTGEEGWEIEMVSVIAYSTYHARQILKKWNLFDEVILFNFSAPLAESNEAGLYTLNETMKAVEGTILETDYHNKYYKPLAHIKA